MKTHKNLYEKLISFENLVLAWKKARKGKTKKSYLIKFEKNLETNLLYLQEELKQEVYQPKPLEDFIIRDPKTRKISKSDFRDRIVHHAIVNVLEPIYEKSFIYDSCASRRKKGNLFALKRFRKFFIKVSENKIFKHKGFKDNNYVRGYCLKADIKHYFQEVNHDILLRILERKIQDKKVLNLITRILKNNAGGGGENKGMPLGNLTSQFFANI
jgi:RNA-directed DNA polymerase